MELRATIDGSSHADDLLFFLLLMVRVMLMTCFFFFSTFYMAYFFFSTFYINHNLPFMNDGEGLVPLFTRVLSSTPCL